MVRKRFLTQRPQAMAARAEQIRRVQQLRRILSDMWTPFVQASDPFCTAEDGDHDNRRVLH